MRVGDFSGSATASESVHATGKRRLPSACHTRAAEEGRAFSGLTGTKMLVEAVESTLIGRVRTGLDLLPALLGALWGRCSRVSGCSVYCARARDATVDDRLLAIDLTGDGAAAPCLRCIGEFDLEGDHKPMSSSSASYSSMWGVDSCARARRPTPADAVGRGNKGAIHVARRGTRGACIAGSVRTPTACE
jgi:hypothetical protein